MEIKMDTSDFTNRMTNKEKVELARILLEVVALDTNNAELDRIAMSIPLLNK